MQCSPAIWRPSHATRCTSCITLPLCFPLPRTRTRDVFPGEMGSGQEMPRLHRAPPCCLSAGGGGRTMQADKDARPESNVRCSREPNPPCPASPASRTCSALLHPPLCSPNLPRPYPFSLAGDRALCLKRAYNSNNCLNPSPSPAGARVTSPGPLGRSPAVSLTSGTCGLSVCAPSAMWSIPPCQQFIRDAERSIRCARG